MDLTRRWAIVLVLWLACACLQAGVPERPRFRIAGPAQGLPSTDIKALAHDRDGYLWIGTADGLARFDGIAMQVWRYDPGRSGGLQGNNVQALLVDAGNRVWVAAEGAGVAVLDAQRRHFKHYRMANHPELASDDVWAMARDGDAVWLGTYGGGLTRIARDGSLRTYRERTSGLPSDTVLSLAVDGEGTLWVGTAAGLARREGDRFVAEPLPEQEGGQIVYSVTLQSDGLWVGGAQGVWTRRGGRWSRPAWAPMFERPNALLTIVTGARGDHWIGSQRGLWHQEGTAPPTPVAPGGPAVPRMVSALLQERGGALWVPVFGRGLGFLRSNWRQLAELRGQEDGLGDALYRALGRASGGGVWMAGMGGSIEHMDAANRIAPLASEAFDRLPRIKPVALAEDPAGRLWLAHRNGLVRIAPDGSVTEWTAESEHDPVPATQIAWLLHAADGSQWLAAAGGGVQQRDPASGRVLLDLPAGAASGLGDADIDAMVLGPDDRPWVAGAGGVRRFDGDLRRFVALPALGSARVNALAFDGRDRLWLQRLTGLERYRRQAGGWALEDRIDARSGVPAVAAMAMVIDERHRVWLMTSRGVYRWDPATRHLRHVGGQDNASSEEFLERAALLRDDGVLVAATADGGLRLIDTRMPDVAPGAPILRFEGLAVRRGGHWVDLDPADTVHLRADDREIRIRTRLLAFDDPAGNRYWSHLDGFDPEWVALGASGDRVFTGLAPGRYTVRAKARDAAGNAAVEQALVFVVPPPWWRSVWALAAYLLAAMALLWLVAGAYRQRIKRRHAWQLAEHKRELLEQASEAKSRFLATLGHEVRTPMTGVLGMAELLQGTHLDPRQRAHVDAIRRAGEHLLRLVNDALDLARIEAGKLDLDNRDFTLKPLLDEVSGLMAPVAERKGLAFVGQLHADAPTALHGDRTRIAQILLNLIGNAVKFTETGHVALETSALQPRGVRFVVADTGPGLNEEQQARLFRRFEQADGARTAARHGGSGLGLAISQELAAAMGGRIRVESAPGAGSRFIVDLPLPAAPASTTGDAAPETTAPPVMRRLLLVEDDPIVAETITGLLRMQGHAVQHAGHGLEALTAIATRRFDAALLDLDLPGMDGLALASALRAQGFGAPLLAVTARSDASAESRARDAGFAGFLRKPVTGDALARALEALLSRLPPVPP